MLKGLYILADSDLIYGSVKDDISKKVHMIAPPQTAESIRDNLHLLKEVDVIFTGWGGPLLDTQFLEAAPHLKAVFYGAGTVRYIVTEEFWNRNIPITSSYAANAIPVTEFTLSQILFSLKRGWHYVNQVKSQKQFVSQVDVPGAYRSTVGLISLGMIGQKVAQLLQSFDIKVIAYDPFVSEEIANELNVELCSLDDIFTYSDVVSLHAPWLKETEQMITGKHFERMKKDATFINTSRGAVVDEEEMIDVLRKRKDLYAILDVTYPEPPIENSPLFTLGNVILTPHIAGSQAKECQRMGAYMLEELERFLKGEQLKWEITEKKAKIMA